jgi:hypothetical protein
MKSKTYQQVMDLVEELRSGPDLFFENDRNQTESMILEYKASYAYDAALDLCPVTPKCKGAPFNDALVLRILETIVAFANTNGGMLILGVAEQKGQVVNDGQKFRCGQMNCQSPCFLALDALPACDIKNLRICGLNRELDLSGMDLDRFQRMIVERFSLTDVRKKKGMSFKHAVYPCDSTSPQKQTTISPSSSPDSLIEDIIHFDYACDNNVYRLCAIVVAPAIDPVTLTIREDGSHTVKSVFPYRQPGKTLLEEDFQRILEYIQKRFNPQMVENFCDRIGQIVEEKLRASKNGAWRSFLVDGSSFELKSGIASTLQNPNGCSQGWFSGGTTIILGSGELKEGTKRNRKTSGVWRIKTEPDCMEKYRMGYLVIGCLRFFGGLHSAKRGSQVEIQFNGKYIDSFSLLVIPPEHSDYFHRIPKPNLPDIWPISACQTVYAWPIQKALVAADGIQTVTIEIDKDVSWDVDYVAFVVGND